MEKDKLVLKYKWYNLINYNLGDKMGNNTIIYYDESEHSRMINQRTLESQNYYDNFIGSYIKVFDEKLLDFEESYLNFEKKYEQRAGRNELKSTTIKISI